MLLTLSTARAVKQGLLSGSITSWHLSASLIDDAANNAFQQHTNFKNLQKKKAVQTTKVAPGTLRIDSCLLASVFNAMLALLVAVLVLVRLLNGPVVAHTTSTYTAFPTGATDAIINTIPCEQSAKVYYYGHEVVRQPRKPPTKKILTYWERPDLQISTRYRA